MNARPLRWVAAVAVVVAVAVAAALVIANRSTTERSRALSGRAVPTSVRHEKLAEAGDHPYTVSRVGNRLVVHRAEGEPAAEEPDADKPAAQEPDARERDRRPGEPQGESELLNGPSAVQVDQRAYPRKYVETRRALRGRRAYQGLPTRASRDDYRRRALANGTAGAAALAGDWAAVGPVNPKVPGFVTYTGRETNNSGRSTAMAIDPNCGPGRCRLWVAAAGGGIWRTNNALAATPSWQPVDNGLTTNSFGSLIVDPTDRTGNTLYAGSGEPNGSGDSEAGLGLFKSTNGGDTWQLVPGSYAVAHDRAIASIAIDPRDPGTIWIATALARHGLASVQGGRRTPPNAPTLGVYRSTDGGQFFTLQLNRPGSGEDPASGNDYFNGAATKLVFDPNDPRQLYASLQGYGIFRLHNPHDGPCGCDDGQWHQMYQALFGNGTFLTDGGRPLEPDFFGARVEFDLADLGSRTRIYVGDTSDQYGVANLLTADGVDGVSNRALLAAERGIDQPSGIRLPWHLRSDSDITASLDGFSSYNFCQNGQCGYDIFVVADPANPDVVWLGGAMAYDELEAFGSPVPRSNGRAVVRSTNGGVSFTDMTNDSTDPPTGQHPDQHAIVFNPNNHNQAFIASDGGIVRTDGSFVDGSGVCDQRTFSGPTAAADLAFCKQVLSVIPGRIDAINNGLNTLQFQSLSLNSAQPYTDVIGGTQDNGTWAWNGAADWFESVGGDGGQSGISNGGATRMHSYYGASLDANFHGNDPVWWAVVSGPMDEAEATGKETFSFYVPVISDPKVPGTYFMGGEYVWRTKDAGGNQSYLDANCLEGTVPYPAPECGDFVRLGRRLSPDGPAGDDFVVALARTPANPGTMWVGLRQGELFRSDNIAAAPAAVHYRALHNPKLPGRFVSGIVVDPGDPNHAWISYSGYSAYTPSTPGHVFEARYQPGSVALTVTDRSYNLGDQPVTGIQVDQPTGDVYASTDFGVARLPHGATSWTVAAGHLPKVATYGLTMSSSARVLYAATHGRGAYRLPLDPAAVIHGPTTGAVGQRLRFTSTGSAGYRQTRLKWRLPDGSTSTSPTVTWRPTANGKQTIRLTVTDKLGHSTTASQTVSVGKHPALTPRFGPVDRTAGGFAVRVTNFDPAFTWKAATTKGRVSISRNGLVKVTRLAPRAAARVTVSARRSGYAKGSARIVGTATRVCGLTVTARPTSVGVPGDGAITLVAKASAAPGCRLRLPRVGVKPRRKAPSVRIAAYQASGKVRVRTSGVGALTVHVREKAVPRTAQGRPNTWHRSWRTR